jgi:hypothetical protein
LMAVIDHGISATTGRGSLMTLNVARLASQSDRAGLRQLIGTKSTWRGPSRPAAADNPSDLYTGHCPTGTSTCCLLTNVWVRSVLMVTAGRLHCRVSLRATVNHRFA